jgi:hypothetical protein
MVLHDILYEILIVRFVRYCSELLGNFLILEILVRCSLIIMKHFYVSFVEFEQVILVFLIHINENYQA